MLIFWGVSFFFVFFAIFTVTLAGDRPSSSVCNGQASFYQTRGFRSQSRSLRRLGWSRFALLPSLFRPKDRRSRTDPHRIQLTEPKTSCRGRRSADRRGGTGRGTGRGEEAEEEDEGEPDDRRRDGEVIDLGVGVVLADADDGVGDRLRFGFCGAVHELGPGQC